MTENRGDLISREALKEHKFVGNKFVQIGGRNNGKTLESINKAYQQGWNDCIDAIIDNAPTVEANSIIDGLNNEIDDLSENLAWYINERNRLLKDRRPQGEWIPVSERLPQDRNWYLGVFRESDTGYIIDLPFVCDYVGYPTEGTTNDAWILRGLTDIDNPSKYYKNLECVAWQPLPEPYHGERQ